MQNAAKLAEPLVDVRDVVESFRTGHLVLPDWDTVLSQAVASLSELQPSGEVEALLPGLLPKLRQLLAVGLPDVPRVVDEVALQVAVVLERTRVPGIPTPEDDDWAFGEASAS